MQITVRHTLSAALLLILFSGCASTGHHFTDEEKMIYFMEVTLGAELGSASEEIKKWTTDGRVAILGHPTRQDERTVHEVIAEINQMIAPIQLSVVEENPSIHLYFVPDQDFGQYEPNYIPGNKGFFWVNSRSCEIYRANILVSSVGLTQQQRTLLIRKELTQVLGLMRDSDRYRDSIFYQEWTNRTDYSPIDRAVVEMLYRPDIKPCMNQMELMSKLIMND